MILDTEAVAVMFGVKRTTVHQWRRRGVLPEPAGFVSGSPYWNRPNLAAWAQETGRTVAVDLGSLLRHQVTTETLSRAQKE